MHVFSSVRGTTSGLKFEPVAFPSRRSRPFYRDKAFPSAAGGDGTIETEKGLFGMGRDPCKSYAVYCEPYLGCVWHEHR